MMALCSPGDNGAPAPVRLLRSSWLEHRAKAMLKARGDDEKAALALPNRQQLEESEPLAFMSIDEIFHGKGRQRRRLQFDAPRIEPWIVALSHCHLSESHPDPRCQQALRFIDLIERERARPGTNFPYGDYGIFLDWCSLYQPDASTGEHRSPEEAESFSSAMEEMDLWYGHRLVRLVVIDVPVGASSSGASAGGCRPQSERAWPAFELGMNSLARQCLHHGRAQPTLFAGGVPAKAPGPRTAKRFAQLLRGKTFSNEGTDRPLVIGLYAASLERMLSAAGELQCGGLGWGDDDAEALAEVLPLCTAARSINLSRNIGIGDKGIAAVCRALAAGAAPRVKEVNLQHLHIGPEATIALRKVNLVRDTNWYV